MNLAISSATSSVFDAGPDASAVYATAGAQAGWRHNGGAGAGGNVVEGVSTSTDPASGPLGPAPLSSAQSSAGKAGHAIAKEVALKTFAARTDNAAAASADEAKTVSPKANRIDQGESQEIHALKAQGQNLSEIAVDLGIPLTRVNDDLETDIPKFTAPVPPGQVAPSSANSSTISLFV